MLVDDFPGRFRLLADVLRIRPGSDEDLERPWRNGSGNMRERAQPSLRGERAWDRSVLTHELSTVASRFWIDAVVQT